ncbi:hypothetical protein ILUMI_06744 [Ignelater luminosus]|uniref:Uncharacterized protein n=1 Tax=Ignelater luminosus TaxID=2038154 RepID=A0A8K0D4R0_IGNLU|nr:hypothetical protein ILUMI_06744 [Ignelater luminosus]
MIVPSTKLIGVLIIGEFLTICYGFGTHTNFFIKRFEHCDPNANYTVDMNFKIKTVGNVQYADGAFMFAVDVGSNIRSNFSIELLTLGSYRHLFSMKEKNLCVAMHKYLGEFIYEIERYARILPGVCPISKVNKYQYCNLLRRSLAIGQFISLCYGYSNTNFFIKRFERCDPNANYSVDMFFNITTVGNVQYADGAFNFAVDVGNNIWSNFSIETLSLHHYRHLFSIREKNLCVAFHKYLGEFMYDIERNAQILPGVCPIAKRFDRCDPKANYSVDMDFKIKTVHNVQYADGAFKFAVDVGNNIRSNCTIELFTLNKYRHLFSINEKNLCQALHKYMGELMYEIERNAGMPPRVCPIPKGTYHLHNYHLDFQKMALQTFPFGKLRFTEIGYDQQNNICLCIIIEVDNRETES